MKEMLHGGPLTITVDGAREAIEQALPIAEYFAKITTTLWDDEAVACIRAVLDSEPLLAWLRRLMNEEAIVGSSGESRTQFVRELGNDSATEEVRAAAEAAGLSWVTLIENAPAIIALVMTILGRRR